MVRVAILIDGDNISPARSRRISTLGQAEGRVDVHRVYANATNGSGWNDVAGVRLVHAGNGKNAADLLLTIDAMEFAVEGAFDTMVLVSSDSDFTHLATRLRERGICVVGVGEAKAPASFRAACARFEVLGQEPSPLPGPKNTAGTTDLDRKIYDVIKTASKNGSGILLSDLNGKMRAGHAIRISTYPEKTWRAYLAARPSLFDLDPRGPEAHVRYKPSGFAS